MLCTRRDFNVVALATIIARHSSKNQRITCAELAGELGCAHSYTEQMIAGLRASNVIEGQRGLRGGFRLVGLPEDYSVYDLLAASKVPAKFEMPKQSVKFDKLVDDYLASITLADLL